MSHTELALALLAPLLLIGAAIAAGVAVARHARSREPPPPSEPSLSITSSGRVRLAGRGQDGAIEVVERTPSGTLRRAGEPRRP